MPPSPLFPPHRRVRAVLLGLAACASLGVPTVAARAQASAGETPGAETGAPSAARPRAGAPAEAGAPSPDALSRDAAASDAGAPAAPDALAGADAAPDALAGAAADAPTKPADAAASQPAPIGAAPPPPALDALDRIRLRGGLRFGFRRDAPPFSYLSPGAVEGGAAAPAGLAVRLCAAVAPAVAEAAGLAPDAPIEWAPVTAAERFEALAAGIIDLHCGPATQTLARRRRIDFSIPWFVDGAGAVFRRGGPERLRDLDDDRVGVLAGTTTEALAADLLSDRAPRARLVRFDSHVAGLRALERGEVEAYMADRSILMYQLGVLRPSVQPVISPRTWSREPYALAMRRGETRLRLAVDAALSAVYGSGDIRGLIRESLGRVQLSPEVEAIYDVVTIPD